MPAQHRSPPGWRARLKRWGRVLRDILYGMSTYDMVRDLNRARARREHLFVLITMGDLLGIPILPPYYALRLLPYVIGRIEGWRFSLLRERDLTDLADFET